MVSLSPSAQIGDVIGERYRIERLLGQGGMGVLYVAEHLFTQRKVALKLLHPSKEDLPELRARFVGEARAAAATRHPHIVDVLDMGLTDDGSPFLIMELLEGVSLDKLIAESGRLDPAQALAYLLPIAGALAVLHDAGIVHRDIKPSNIFLSRDGRGVVHPKLLDFGLARAVSDLRLTRSGIVLGTPMYMAPEHAAGEEVTVQSDVWSFGVVVYEALAGEPPFTSRDSQAIAAQVLAGQTRPLRKACPEVPASLADAVERALRGSRDLRYKNIREMAACLVAGGVLSGLALPEHPDPLGLPEYRSWIANPAQLASTAEIAVPRASATSEERGRFVEAATTGKAPIPAATGPRVPRVVALLLITALGLGITWWLGQAEDPSRPAPIENRLVPRESPSAFPGVAPSAPSAPSTSAQPSSTERTGAAQPGPSATTKEPATTQELAAPAAPTVPADALPAPKPARRAAKRDPNKPLDTKPRVLPKSQGGVEIESEWK